MAVGRWALVLQPEQPGSGAGTLGASAGAAEGQHGGSPVCTAELLCLLSQRPRGAGGLLYPDWSLLHQRFEMFFYI